MPEACQSTDQHRLIHFGPGAETQRAFGDQRRHVTKPGQDSVAQQVQSVFADDIRATVDDDCI